MVVNMFDKSIEATVKKPESGGNARSRKASHMLGIFDPRTGSESPATIPADQFTDLEEPARPSPGPTSPVAQEPVSPWTTRRSSNEVVDAPFITRDPSLSGSAYGSKAVSPLQHEHDPYFRQQDLAKRPEQPEGRNSYKASRTSTPSDVVVGGTKTQDQHPSEEEHISAAVYYPHSGPSPEEIERYTSPGEVISPELEAGRQPPPSGDIVLSADNKTIEALGGTAHIDISVVSQHEKKVFHGNYRPLEGQSFDEPPPLSPFF